jgi:hypothetical protein
MRQRRARYHARAIAVSESFDPALWSIATALSAAIIYLGWLG